MYVKKIVTKQNPVDDFKSCLNRVRIISSMIRTIMAAIIVVLASFAVSAQDKGLYHVLGTELSVFPFNVTEQAVALTFVNVESQSKLLIVPSLYYGRGYRFNGFQIEVTLGGSYLNKSHQISLVELTTPLGYLAENRERTLYIDQVTINPKLSILGEVVKNLAIKSSFEAPIKVVDNTRVNYVNTTYWSNQSLSGNDYILLQTPEVLDESIEYSSLWGAGVHIIASLGAEWRAFNWDFGYITHERPRTFSIYALYSVHLSNNNKILDGTELGNYITSGLKVTF